MVTNWLYWMLGGNRRYCFIPSNHIARMARRWQASGEWEPTHAIVRDDLRR